MSTLCMFTCAQGNKLFIQSNNFVTETDFFLFWASFTGVLLYSLDVGLLIGVGLNVMVVLKQSARPKVKVEKSFTVQVGCINAM